MLRLPLHLYPRSSDVLMGLKVSVVTLPDDCMVISFSVTITSPSTSLHCEVGVLTKPGTAWMIQLMVYSDPATGLPALLTMAVKGLGGTVCVLVLVCVCVCVGGGQRDNVI